MNEKKIPLIVICGPTASGKTAASIALAQKIGAEIVSADSMQIYTGMDMASAKPSEEEMCGITHHLLSFVESEQPFSVADYTALAHEKLRDMASRGKIPMLVGGTGLYISSVVDNISFSEQPSSTEVREKLRADALIYGNDEMHRRLSEIDPQAAASIHPNNLHRVLRAIEAYELTGKTLTEQKALSRLSPSPYDALILGIDFRDRQKLYERINLRVDKMLSDGLLDEARDFYGKYRNMPTAAQAIGLKELIPFFEGKAELEQCIETIKRETRRYAKRQLTWFRRDERVRWVYADEENTGKKIFEIFENSIAKTDFI